MGARASLGASASAIGAAYHAGLCRHRQSTVLLGRAHHPLVVAADSRLPAEVPLERRLIEMLTSAAEQAIAPIAVLATPPPVDIFVAVPEARAGVGSRVSERLLDAAKRSAGDRVRVGEAQAFAAGRAGGLASLEIALERLASGRSSACLWCGVDSYLAPATLDALDGAGLLHAGGARWGFVPGEAAGACLLVAGETAQHMGTGALAVVRAAASAVEPEGEIVLGRALTAATRTVLAAMPVGERVHRVYADLNGERERVDGVGFTLARIADRVAAHPCLATPVDRLGEVGAASAPLFATLAVMAAQLGRAPGPNVLLWTTGPGPLCGAALLDVPVVRREI
jgi:3-oxoacyl-[acyl-carrier-protein] synthase-1